MNKTFTILKQYSPLKPDICQYFAMKTILQKWQQSDISRQTCVLSHCWCQVSVYHNSITKLPNWQLQLVGQARSAYVCFTEHELLTSLRTELVTQSMRTRTAWVLGRVPQKPDPLQSSKLVFLPTFENSELVLLVSPYHESEANIQVTWTGSITISTMFPGKPEQGGHPSSLLFFSRWVAVH